MERLFYHNYITLETIHILLMESNQWITKKYHSQFFHYRGMEISPGFDLWPLSHSFLLCYVFLRRMTIFVNFSAIDVFFELSAILSRVLCVGCQHREKFQELNYLLAHVAEMHSAIHVKLRIPVKEKEMVFFKENYVTVTFLLWMWYINNLY